MMPILEFFNPRNTGHTPSGHRQQGFTLIEIMLVMVITGVIIGMVALSIGSNPATNLDREGRRLLAVMNQASEEAVLQSMEFALALSVDSKTEQAQYQLLVLDKQELQWIAPKATGRNDDLWAVHKLDRDVVMDLSIEGQQLNQQQLEQLARVQALESQAALRPSILLLSSGEMTPFTLKLRYRSMDYSVSLESDGYSGVFLNE